jgi:hypothetical protein
MNKAQLTYAEMEALLEQRREETRNDPFERMAREMAAEREHGHLNHEYFSCDEDEQSSQRWNKGWK